MSDEEAKSLPMTYDEELAAEAAAASAAERPQNAEITCKGGILKYEKEERETLEVVIVADIHSRRYYESEMDDDNPQNPVCWAYSPDGKNWVPHSEATKPQCDSCVNCEWNQYETAVKGKGKACTERRTLIVMPADASPEEVPTAELARFEMPPTSSREDYPKFVKGLAMIHGLPPSAAYVTLGCKPDSKAMYRVTFSTGRGDGAVKVPMEVYRAVKERKEEALQMAQKVYEPNPELTEEQIMAREAREEAKRSRGRKMK